MDVTRYLDRIGFVAPLATDTATLAQVHRRHLLAIPYENLDVQLGRLRDISVEAAYAKIVEGGRRGGWCYEMNGLLGWALCELGFDVQRMTGGVGSTERGEDALGNHLVLSVVVDGTRWLCDVGLGDGLATPALLQPGTFEQRGRTYRLEQLADDRYRFHNAEGVLPPDFDLVDGRADEALLADKCAELQADAESTFRQNLIVQRLRDDGGTEMLFGRMHITVTVGERTTRILDDVDELIDVLETTFGIADPDAAELWDPVVARHEALFGPPAADQR